ncbi:unnamed protein product [Cuscuta epithymum]|uniref:Uncharacterized protein n=1 Tax=Cuscuta epithymum TaxID=186058 RepID=A0AAV0FAI3_9ASTE|nr:unnamed protein product [Cuscuta epithymum]
MCTRERVLPWFEDNWLRGGICVWIVFFFFVFGFGKDLCLDSFFLCLDFVDFSLSFSMNSFADFIFVSRHCLKLVTFVFWSLAHLSQAPQREQFANGVILIC